MSEEQKSTAPAGTPTLTLNKPLQIPDVEPVKQDELASLKERAISMGIGFSNNIGVDALKAKINDKLNGTKTEVDEQEDPIPSVDEPVSQYDMPLNEVTDQAILRERMFKENMFLVRVRITNLNPLKKDVTAEWVTVHNKYLGTVRKLIPFGEATDNGYHIPKILLDVLKERRFLSLKNNAKKGPASAPEQQWVKEFAIEELTPLTQAELDQLARQQAAARGM